MKKLYNIKRGMNPNAMPSARQRFYHDYRWRRLRGIRYVNGCVDNLGFESINTCSVIRKNVTVNSFLDLKVILPSINEDYDCDHKILLYNSIEVRKSSLKDNGGKILPWF